MAFLDSFVSKINEATGNIPDDGTNMLMRLGFGMQGGNALSAHMRHVDEMKKKKESESKLASLAPRIQAGDKSALLELAIANPSAASALATLFTKDNAPLTDVAKLKADLDAGRIDKATYDRRLAKEVAPTEKNYKQFQLQNAAFADMMVKAEETLQPYETLAEQGKFDPVNLTQAGLSNIPSFGLGGFLGNLALSEDQQKYRQAQEAWVRAKLRKESGAAIGVKEMEDEIKTFFPRPGDKMEVIKQKAMMRNEATRSMQKQSGGAYDDMYGAVEEEVITPIFTKKRRVKFGELPK